ncbi:MAG: hypothetical protein AAGB02_06895 [Pseudomonadota bacterium]
MWVFLCASLGGFTKANAQTPLSPNGSLTGDDPDGTQNGSGDAFAASVDSWKNWVFVGAPRETSARDGADLQDGAVYVYKRRNNGKLVLKQKLSMPGSSPTGDRFGAGVDAAKKWLFIAAADDRDFSGQTDPSGNDFSFAGQVHVYRLISGVWTFRQTLVAPSPSAFGGVRRAHASL